MTSFSSFFPGQGQPRQQISQRFAGAGSRFHHAYGPFPPFAGFRQRVEYFGDHSALPRPGPKTARMKNPPIIRLNLLFEDIHRNAFQAKNA